MYSGKKAFNEVFKDNDSNDLECYIFVFHKYNKFLHQLKHIKNGRKFCLLMMS